MPLVYLYTGVMGTLVVAFVAVRSRRAHTALVRAQLGAHDPEDGHACACSVEGLEHINPSQTAIYAANHLSALDIPVLYACLPVQFRIMAKKELFRYPFLGWHLKRSGQIPIDAGDARASLRSLNRTSESLRARHVRWWFFRKADAPPRGNFRNSWAVPFTSQSRRRCRSCRSPLSEPTRCCR